MNRTEELNTTEKMKKRKRERKEFIYSLTPHGMQKLGDQTETSRPDTLVPTKPRNSSLVSRSSAN